MNREEFSQDVFRTSVKNTRQLFDSTRLNDNPGDRPCFVDFARHSSGSWETKDPESQRIKWVDGKNSTTLALESFTEGGMTKMRVRLVPIVYLSNGSEEKEVPSLSLQVSSIEVKSIKADSDELFITGTDKEGQEKKFKITSTGKYELI